MEIENLAEKVKKAKEAVDSLDEPLKTEAFKKILDKLLETPSQYQQSNNIYEKTVGKKKKILKNKNSKKGFVEVGLKLKEESEKNKRALADKINRSEHSEIHDLNKILPLALYVLNMMKEKGVKDLTPPEIQFIL